MLTEIYAHPKFPYDWIVREADQTYLVPANATGQPRRPIGAASVLLRPEHRVGPNTASLLRRLWADTVTR